MTIHTDSNSNFLTNYPFSILDMDGSREEWQKIYNPYINLINKNIISLKKKSINLFRNHNFAFNNDFQQRIADLIITEVEKERFNPISKNLRNDLIKQKEKIEDQYSDVVEKENYNLKITFIFTNKKLHPMKLMQLLKLSGEVKKFTELLHKKELKKYSKIIPQIIFISIFGFEPSIGDYLSNNLYGKLNRIIPILVVPPIDNTLWNNYIVENSMDDNNNYNKPNLGINFEDYNALRNNGAVNQFQVKKIESYYRDLKETKDISDYNSQQLNFWADNLSINNSSTLLDVKNSREKIKELVIELSIDKNLK